MVKKGDHTLDINMIMTLEKKLDISVRRFLSMPIEDDKDDEDE